MTLLVTVDASDQSWNVVPHAREFGRAFNLPLKLVRVLNPLLDVGDEFGPSVRESADRVAARWDSELEERLKQQGLDVERTVEVVRQRESVEEAIVRVAGEVGATAIAMNSRGTGLIRHALLGSTAMGVVGRVDRPVLLTGPKAQAPAGTTGYRLIVTSDGSEASRTAVDAVAPLLEGTEVTVTLLMVYARAVGDQSPTAEKEAAEAYLDELRTTLPATSSVDLKVVDAGGFESVGHAILRAAEETGANAIAMATHGHSVVRHVFAGSTALGVLGNSPIPVLFTRAIK